jgi:hypothetical protein
VQNVVKPRSKSTFATDGLKAMRKMAQYPCWVVHESIGLNNKVSWRDVTDCSKVLLPEANDLRRDGESAASETLVMLSDSCYYPAPFSCQDFAGAKSAMRYLRLTLVISSLISSGCSSLLARSGVDLSALATREQVRAEFGEPEASGTTEDGYYEEYHSRRKISDPVIASAYGMMFVMYFGLGEAVSLPIEAGRLASTTISGQEIRVTYDSADQVDRILIDDDSHRFQVTPNDITSDENSESSVRQPLRFTSGGSDGP